MLNKLKKQNRENGSVSIEATIALTAFLLIIQKRYVTIAPNYTYSSNLVDSESTYTKCEMKLKFIVFFCFCFIFTILLSVFSKKENREVKHE